MKIANIGTGISGLVTAHLLRQDHEITVFEASNYVGGHTVTTPVESADGPWRSTPASSFTAKEDTVLSAPKTRANLLGELSNGRRDPWLLFARTADPGGRHQEEDSWTGH